MTEHTSTENSKPKKITKDQSRDTGMAIVLLLLLVFLARKREGWLFAAMAVHVINMIFPQVYKPAAVVWLGFSEKLGAISSKVLLSIVFFGVVTPIGIVRRWLGKDSLNLRGFKTSKDSAMWERNHTYVGSDIEKPY